MLDSVIPTSKQQPWKPNVLPSRVQPSTSSGCWYGQAMQDGTLPTTDMLSYLGSHAAPQGLILRAAQLEPSAVCKKHRNTPTTHSGRSISRWIDFITAVTHVSHQSPELRVSHAVIFPPRAVLYQDHQVGISRSQDDPYRTEQRTYPPHAVLHMLSSLRILDEGMYEVMYQFP